MAKINWKVLGIGATIFGGIFTIIADLANDRKTSEEIREEVRNEFDRRNGGES